MGSNLLMYFIIFFFPLKENNILGVNSHLSEVQQFPLVLFQIIILLLNSCKIISNTSS